MKNVDVMFSSEFDDWNTPGVVLERVRRVDEIGLDPFGNAQSIVGARVEFRLSRGQNALRLDWRGYGMVFSNPPYGDALPACMRRIAHFAALEVEQQVLVPHRTDTAWYRDNIGGLAAKCELWGRLQHPRGVADSSQLGLFVAGEAPSAAHDGPGESAPFPSVVLYYGQRIERFIAAFEDAGEIWVR